MVDSLCIGAELLFIPHYVNTPKSTPMACDELMEGFAYPALVIDLCSRRVVGWSMQSRQATDVVLQALHMAMWRRKPKQRVLIHADHARRSPAWIGQPATGFTISCTR